MKQAIYYGRHYNEFRSPDTRRDMENIGTDKNGVPVTLMGEGTAPCVQRELPGYAFYSFYSEGVAPGGPAILKDGHTMFPQDIVKDLNRKSYLEEHLASKGAEFFPLKNDTWYWVSFDGEKAPACYKENVDCFYSYHFGGIPSRQVSVIREA